MPITFDAPNRRIILDSSSASASEIWSRWVDWLALSDNSKWPLAMRQVGGDDLGGGLSIPPYIFLLNGWRVRPMESSHTLVLTGNLFVDGGGVPIVPTLGNYNVSAQYTVPVQAQGIATSGSTGPSASQIADAVAQRVIESGLTMEQMLRIMLAGISGGRSGIAPGPGTVRYKSRDGSKDRIVLTHDALGNGTPTVDGT